MGKKHKNNRYPFKLHRRIGFRLTFSFILFGLYIGLFVYILTMVLDTSAFAASLGSSIYSHINKFYNKRPDKTLHNINSSEPNRNGVHLEIYFYSTNEAWVKVILSAGKEPAFTNINPVLYPLLERVRISTTPDKNGRSQLPFYFNYSKSGSSMPSNHSGILDLFILIKNHDQDVSPVKGSPVKYLFLRIAIDSGFIFSRLSADRDLLIGYSVILILFSLVLGKTFAHKLTRPLETLTEAAYQVAKGDYKFRNTIHGKDEFGFLGKTLNYMAEQVDRHIDEISYREKTMEAMNLIDKTVVSELLNPKVVDMVAEVVASFMPGGMVLLVIPDYSARVFKLSVYQSSGFFSTRVKKDPLPFESLDMQEIVNKREMEEIILDREGCKLPEWLSLFIEMPKGTLFHAPLFSAGIYQGSCIIIEEKRLGFNENEKQSIGMLADQVGVALQNARIYREKEELLLNLLLALTRAIDAKSKWTGGHSERVADYSVKLAKALAMPEKELETIKISGLLHDIGKIATPETILDKPGKLTVEEYSIIKKHPEEGARIIGTIASYETIVPGILYHHEHWDGSGYPNGLKADEIPPIARIMAIADVYDAIIADRPYREGMGREKALVFMQENSGVLFDPEMADVFIKKVL